MADCSFVSRNGSKCQFVDRPGTRTYVYHDKPYCIFHAPSDYKKTWPEVATEVEAIPGINTFLSEVSRENHNSLTNFSGTVFPPNSSLGTYTNTTPLDLSECHFGPNCNITVAMHSNVSDVTFADSKFSGPFTVHFHGPIADADLRNCVFHGDAKFIVSSGNVRILDVRDSQFLGPLELRMLQITHTANFDRVRFHCPVDFVETNFPQNTSLRGTRFLKGVYVAEAEGSYRHLRKALAENKARDEEGMLFIVEQRCARLKYPWYSARRWFSIIYDAISRFGSSFERPFVYLVAIQVASFLTYYSLAAQPSGRNKPINEFAIFSLAQVLRPFEIFSSNGYMALKQSSLFETLALAYIPYIAAIQTMSTLIVFALFVLALRRRFMRE